VTNQSTMPAVIRESPEIQNDRVASPLIVDLEGALLKVDPFYESVIFGLFSKPSRALLCLFELRRGKAAFQHTSSVFPDLDVNSLPVHEDLVDYLKHEATAGRKIHLVTAADRNFALKIAERFSIFDTVLSVGKDEELQDSARASRLAQLFPDGFVYVSGSLADALVWRNAQAVVAVADDVKLANAIRSTGTPLEQVFETRSRKAAVWIKALRLHQWAKNLIVLVPVVLGWRQVTPASVVTTVVMTGLLCMVASLTYIANDLADLVSDRKHWSKRRRGVASGAIPARDGLIVVSLALPPICLVALIVSPLAGACLLLYAVVTLGYSFAWKRIPLFDAFIIALLFTIRILIGIAAAHVQPSAWLLTFSMFFFFSLALAKRHTEILRAAEHNLKKLEGRGYQAGDESLTLAFGSAASMASILIVVIYLVEEIFARQIYTTPEWLWVAPAAIFLFCCRIWLLSHRGRMTDDPVAFALRDGVSWGLGVFVALGILLAL
jgi:4-hydroxybenzoate polyprenyltransferase